MNKPLVTLFACLLILAHGCSDDGDAEPTASTAPSTPRATAEPQPTRTAPAAVEGELEVTGIVGAVNLSSRSIQIDRIRGADVTQIAIAPNTVMRTAEGNSIGLGQIRPSDRIIARGPLSERGDSLVATLIEVQEVVPSSAPGG